MARTIFRPLLLTSWSQFKLLRSLILKKLVGYDKFYKTKWEPKNKFIFLLDIHMSYETCYSVKQISKDAPNSTCLAQYGVLFSKNIVDSHNESNIIDDSKGKY